MELQHKLYTIFDKKSGTWDRPFTAPTHGAAERMFAQAINEGDSMLKQYPEDFALWNIGTFDPTTGQVAGEKQQLVAEGLQLKKTQLNG
jgi:hypothetical protein